MKETLDTLLTKYERIAIHLDEKDKRIWCANEAISLGWGGISKVSEVIGITRKTILKGVKELKSQEKVEENRVRKKGAGRKRAIDKDKELEKDIEICVESSTRGDPESPLIWTSKSTRNISNELNKESHRTSHSMVSRILIKKGYSLQSNKKTIEGGDNPDRNEQFEFINKKAKEFQSKNIPVISVDAKKKENIGNFKNNTSTKLSNHGKEYHKKGKAPDVNVYDFVDKEKGKVTPYGIYDLSQNNGWVSVGISSDTAKFAVNSIRSWWNELGIKSYIDAKEIYINADGGGSNGSRTRLWKTELQILSNELDKIIHVSHFPPGTSKWNKIEHKMFSFISKNWRGTPLIDRATVVNLIGNTKTKSGLKIWARLDENTYEKGIKISDELLNSVNIKKEDFHGEWNYIIYPKIG